MSTIEKWILRALPVIVPFPTLYLVCLGLMANNWHIVAAVIAGLGLEILGYFAVTLIGGVTQHNRTLNVVTEKHLFIPVWRAWLPSGAYVLIAVTLTLFIKIIPALYVWSVAVFPFVGLLGAWTQAEWRVLENHTDAKIKARAEAKEQREKDKKEKKEREESERKQAAELAKQAQAIAEQPEPVAKVEPPALTDDNLLAQWNANPAATDANLAQVFGVSHTTIGNHRKRLQAAGIISKDGKQVRINAFANMVVAEAK